MKLSDYTTEELKRLTTLTEATAKPSEFIRDEAGGITLRVDNGAVSAKGVHRSYLCKNLKERRVTSFTDPTELDPPQAEMLAELERRERPVLSNATHAGRRVRSGSDETGLIVSPWAARKLYPNASADDVVWVSDRDGAARIFTLGTLVLL